MSQKSNISTRQAILDAAVTEFWAHGFRGASVRVICAAAGASSNAITYHFGSKENLYKEIFERFAALQLESAHSALSGELRSQEEFRVRLEMFFGQLLQTYLENRKTLLIILREFEQLLPESDESALRELMEVNRALTDFVQRGKEQGFVRSDVDTSLVAGTLLDRLMGQAQYPHAHKKFFNVTSLDPEYRAHWVRASLGLVLDGIIPREEPA